MLCHQIFAPLKWRHKIKKQNICNHSVWLLPKWQEMTWLDLQQLTESCHVIKTKSLDSRTFCTWRTHPAAHPITSRAQLSSVMFYPVFTEANNSLKINYSHKSEHLSLQRCNKELDRNHLQWRVSHLQVGGPCAAARRERSLPLAVHLDCKLYLDLLWKENQQYQNKEPYNHKDIPG